MSGAFAGVTRQPPFDRDAERAVLGSLLLDTSPDVFEEVAGLITADAFFVESHRAVWRAIAAVHARGDSPDMVTVTEQLRRSNGLEAVGGVAALVGMVDDVPVSAYVTQYADIVREKARLRSIISSAGEALQGAYDQQASEDVAERLEAQLLKLSAEDALGVVRADEAAAEAMKLLTAYQERRGAPIGVPMGLADVDGLLSGLQRGKLYVLAARPAMGKSALAVQAAVHAALNGTPAALVSLEMSTPELMMRAACGEAKVDMKRAQDGQLLDRDWTRLTDAFGRLAAAPLYFLDAGLLGELTARRLQVEARRLVGRHGVQLLVLDYLQLMSGDGRRGGAENRQQEISVISRGLKLLARELDVPVLALSQLSRAVESRADKRPMLSDLRESGSIEQDADAVMFLYRDEYYNEHTEEPGVAELHVAKQRSGPTGMVKLYWSGPHTRFAGLARGAVGE